MQAQAFTSGNEAFSVVFKSRRTAVDMNLGCLANPRPQADDIVFTLAKRRALVPLPSPGLDDPQDEFHCLKLTGGEQGEEVFVLGAAGFKIGRSAPADIFLAHHSVSREHCLIGLVNDELFVTDLNSTNGTFVDGQRVGGTTIVPVGAALQVGQISFTHEIRTRSEAQQIGQAHKH